MKKQAFFLLMLLALAAASADAQLEDLRDEAPCRAGQAMDACKAYLMKECTASAMLITWPWKRRMGSCAALKRRCCSQLEQVPATCRCEAIRSTVQEVMQGSQQQGGGGHPTMMSEVKQMAKTLLSICNMHPSHCDIPTTNEAS